MKKRGAIFIEVLVSILLFIVGILALTGTLFYGVKVVAESKEQTIKEQDYKNAVEGKALDIINDSFNNTTKLPLAQLPSLPNVVFNLNKNDSSKTLTLKLYRYKQEGKEGTDMYLLLK